MGLVIPELSLDFRPIFVPKTISEFIKGVSTIENVPERKSKVDDFVKRLEDEMRKIDAFKRELPLCMFLLNDAILVLKEERVKCEKPIDKPVLEEFIPVKDDSDANGGLNINEKENDNRDKKTWMSSVQLWKTDDYPISDSSYNQKQNCKTETKRNEKEHGLLTEDPFRSSRMRTGGTAFMPFKSYPAYQPTTVRKEDKDKFTTHVLSLLTPGIKNPKDQESGSFPAPNAQSNSRMGLHPPPLQQTTRKQRRCWSPELHRRFVNALQQLGGPQVATPKQIRDLMQVDGLTNDEVKSHLQKYRLHTRRFPAGTAGAVNQAVVLGGLWISDDQYDESWKGDSSQSESPQGPLHLACGGGGTSTTGGGDSMEDDEDVRSESYCWKFDIQKTMP